MTITPKAIESISMHPNIVGMKDTSPGNIGRYLEVCGDNFDVRLGIEYVSERLKHLEEKQKGERDSRDL